MKKICIVLVSLILIFLVSFKAEAVVWSYKWENTYVEVPIYSSLSPYLEVPKATLYKDDTLVSDAKIVYNTQGDWLYYLKDVDTNKPGEYKVWYKVSEMKYMPGTCHNYKQLITFKVYDDIPPEIILLKNEITLPLNSKKVDYKAYFQVKENLDDYIVDIDDSAVDYNNQGTYNVLISVIDAGDNKETATLKVDIKDDNGPIITFLGSKETVKNYIEVEKGEDFDFTPYFKAVDALDGDVTDTITYTSFDINKVGTYDVTFSFSDLMGNTSNMSVLVKVVDKLPPTLTLTEPSITLDYQTEPSVELFRKYIEEAKDGIEDLTKEVKIDYSEIKLEVGTYNVYYTLVDDSLNEVTKTLVVNYVTNKNPELIINDVVINVGENVDLKDYVEVIDESDKRAKENLEIDTTNFNNKVPGIYYLNVLCNNSSGLYTNGYMKVTVKDDTTNNAKLANIVIIGLAAIGSVGIVIYLLVKKKRNKSAT